MPSNEKRFRSTSPIAVVFLAVLMAMLLAVPTPASADHRPNHVRDSEEPLLVGEGVPGLVVPLVEDVAVAEEAPAEVEDPSAKDFSDKKKEPANDVAGDARADRKDERPKLGKEKADKLTGSEEAVIGPKHSCADEGCRKPETKGQEASGGLVSETVTGAGVILTPGNPSSHGPMEGRAGFARVLSVGGREGGTSDGGGFFFYGAAILEASQPSLALSVKALNDADGDGIYSDSETAPAAGADIDFKVIITNMGATAFEIATVSHSFTQESGRAHVEVCADLGGLTLAFGETLACSFSVADYSPPTGESVVNTVTASATEVAGSGRRGTSDSDNTTVTTLLADQVLAVAIERAPGSLAFTGIDVSRLVALALLLLAAGGAALYLSRIRMRGPERPVVWVGPRFRVAGLSTTVLKDRRSAETPARR